MFISSEDLLQLRWGALAEQTWPAFRSGQAEPVSKPEHGSMVIRQGLVTAGSVQKAAASLLTSQITVYEIGSDGGNVGATA